MSRNNTSRLLAKTLLILGAVVLSIGLALLIRMVFFKPLPAKAPSEQLDIDTQDEALPEEQPNDPQLLEEEQLEKSTIE